MKHVTPHPPHPHTPTPPQKSCFSYIISQHIETSMINVCYPGSSWWSSWHSKHNNGNFERTKRNRFTLLLRQRLVIFFVAMTKDSDFKEIKLSVKCRPTHFMLRKLLLNIIFKYPLAYMCYNTGYNVEIF